MSRAKPSLARRASFEAFSLISPDVTDFPPLQFTGTLRPSQREAVEIARRKLAEGHRRLHIVAPPGSGKTILGLYLWAECVRRPALILSPNSAIQAQWATKAGGFCPGLALDDLTSTDSEQPRWLTSLTYQAVTLPRRGGEDLDVAAVELWLENLIQQNQARDADEAQRWIDDLRQHNPDYHGERLASYRKQHRDALAQAGQSLPLLHDSSRAVLQRLKDRGVGLIVLDECHHLLGHWGRVLADAHDFLDGPVVVGLTATPPDRDGKDQVDLDR
ncbi:MAG: DEAD/DEAH box helicase family protein, partial [Candidatus Saccharimonas sp.]|nr:DEAD/DEAH box helicase family protein [Planctomycetaceae bacterium]